MKKLFCLGLVVFLIGSVLAMNLYMSWTIFDDIEVERGFHGYYMVNITDTLQRNPFVRWGTKDNETYTLTVTAEDEGGKFFKKYDKSFEITNNTFYQYDVYLNVPKGTKIGDYPYQLCGTICNEGVTICLAICQQGDVIVR